MRYFDASAWSSDTCVNKAVWEPATSRLSEVEVMSARSSAAARVASGRCDPTRERRLLAGTIERGDSHRRLRRWLHCAIKTSTLKESRQNAMAQLHMERCELTYEGSFLKPEFWLVDSPGKVCDILLEALDAFGCTAADLVLEEGEPGERGVTCNVDDLDARVTIHGDRIEIHCSNFANGSAAKITTILTNVWAALAGPGAAAKTHSFLFEADTEIRGASYREALNRLAPVPQSLPSGTETAVVYYLPAEPGSGRRESSLVLNRSAEGERGLQVNATLVYEAESVKPEAAISAAENRLGDLLRDLGLQWTEE